MFSRDFSSCERSRREGSGRPDPGGLTSSNYTITYVDGTLGVTPAALTITALNATKVYGQANPAFSVSFAGFVNRATLAEALSVADRLFTIVVEPQQRDWQAVRQERWNAPDRARLSLDIVKRKITFGGRVIFEDARRISRGQAARSRLAPDADRAH